MNTMVLIRGASLFAPEELGILDVLLGGGKILKIGKALPLPEEYGIEVIEDRKSVV